MLVKVWYVPSVTGKKEYEPLPCVIPVTHIVSRNCRRAGAGASINYIVGEDDVSIQDASTMLKTYRDNDTESGNEIQVSAPFDF